MNVQTAVFHRKRHLTIELGTWLVLILLALGIAFAPLPPGAPIPMSRTLRLEAGSFAFSPAVLEVNPGDRVTIELAATDVTHGLYLDGYALELVAEPGQMGIVTFTADKSGTFRFRCSVACGPLHPFMIGKLKVGPDLLLWRGIGFAALAVVGSSLIASRKRDTENLT